MTTAPRPRSFACTVTARWPRIDDHGLKASPPQPRLGVHTTTVTARWACFDSLRRRLDSCLASTATARRLRYHAHRYGTAAMPTRLRHDLKATTQRLHIHSHSSAATPAHPRLHGHGTTALPARSRLGVHTTTVTARWACFDYIDSLRLRPDSCLASTATARRLHYHGYGSTATPPQS